MNGQVHDLSGGLAMLPDRFDRLGLTSSLSDHSAATRAALGPHRVGDIIRDLEIVMFNKNPIIKPY